MLIDACIFFFSKYRFKFLWRNILRGHQNQTFQHLQFRQTKMTKIKNKNEVEYR
ncbi:hypothetical protein KFK09_013450 [Dendrobium nobile]|uniref:Uncharacterized protein n=1 Tax=Dendrobium nobile TaxID=94219 RepID=A0A8T3B945_DENNO|nr:hypothetical protein KFK09_013450 [Dendrobium nobile]